MLRGYHGKIDFDLQDYDLQDYKDAAGQRTNYLAVSGQFTDHQDSVRLQAFVCKYANRLSYGHVVELLEDMTGFGLMSRSHACHLVERSADRQADEAIVYLQTQIMPRNAAKRAELVAYLKKHTSEIINYEKRKMAGKKIGSGVVEKANDLNCGASSEKERHGLEQNRFGEPCHSQSLRNQ